MNKQELKEQVSSLPSLLGWQGHGAKVMIAKDIVLGLIDQLDEPKKVVVPKFVAEWLEEQKKAYNLFGVLVEIDNAPQNVLKWFHRSSFALFEIRMNIIARAFLDGYEIEQEKLYTVEIPNCKGWLVLTSVNGILSLDHIHKHFPVKLTESEIRKDFDWAWQAGFAKEVE